MPKTFTARVILEARNFAIDVNYIEKELFSYSPNAITWCIGV